MELDTPGQSNTQQEILPKTAILTVTTDEDEEL